MTSLSLSDIKVSSIGNILKMGRLFPKDDRILIVPHESIRPNRQWVDVTKAVIRGGADAILTTPGILKKYYKEVCWEYSCYYHSSS